jgi:predicted MFS family arabinose efflux permease
MSLFLLARVDTLFDYGLAACLFTFSFGLGIPYSITAVADLDIDGRYVVLTVPAIGIGVMLAPAFGGYLTGAKGYEALLWAGGVAVLAALVTALTSLRIGLPHARRTREQMGLDAPDPML